MDARSHTPPARLGLLLVCVAGVVWGTIGPAVDVVVDRSPLSVWSTGAYRSGFAVLALAVAVVALRRAVACRAVLAADPARAVAVGALTGVFQVLFFVSVVSVGVSVATVVTLGVAPVVPMLVRAVADRRPPAGGELLAVVVAVVGLLLVSLGGSGDTDSAHPVLGIVTALGSGVAFGLSADLGGPLSQAHDSLAVAAVTMTVAAVVVAATGLSVALARQEPMTTSDGVSWLLIGYLGVGTMAIAYLLFFIGLRTTPSGTAVLGALLEPVTAVAIAALFLGERLSVAGVIGSLLIVATIASLGRRPAPPH